MATDFWSSSHYRRWIVDAVTLRRSKSEDLRYVDDPRYIDLLGIFFGNLISKLGKKLSLRQRVIATATVFFRRFYFKNSYCETDPFMVAAACCYVAAKAEESPVHIKTVVVEARSLFSQDLYGIKNFPSDNSKLAEMEFYLLDDLECDLTVFHPYRTLLALCKKEDFNRSHTSVPFAEAEAGELGTGIGAEDSQRYWGTGEGRLEMNEGALQFAWFIINDTYRSELCLLYPPHLIAVAAIYLTLILHQSTRETVAPLLNQSHTKNSSQSSGDVTMSSADSSQPRRSSRQITTPRKQQDPIDFLAGLNLSMPMVANIAQQIIALYSLWDHYKEDNVPESRSAGHSSNASPRAPPSTPGTSTSSSGKRKAPGATSATGSTSAAAAPAATMSRSASLQSSGTGTNTNPALGNSAAGTPKSDGAGTAMGILGIVTPSFLTKMLVRMREAKMEDLAHPANGRPTVVNKILERTQAAG